MADEAGWSVEPRCEIGGLHAQTTMVARVASIISNRGSCGANQKASGNQVSVAGPMRLAASGVHGRR